MPQEPKKWHTKHKFGAKKRKKKKKQVSCGGCRRLMMSSLTVERAKQLWQQADAVCFDVDSTVCQDEGLDELAKFCGVGREVQEWTNKAMGGGVSFREALTARLNIIRPSCQQLSDFITQHPPQLTPGVKELVAVLRKRECAVYLVSGGFQSIIQPAASLLGVPSHHVFANRLKFYYNGEYAGFDESQPTSESGGKRRVAEKLKTEFKHKTLIAIGDGATDMEARPPADAFIGFGGNVVRESVKQKADWFVTDFEELISCLQ